MQTYGPDLLWFEGRFALSKELSITKWNTILSSCHVLLFPRSPSSVLWRKMCIIFTRKAAMHLITVQTWNTKYSSKETIMLYPPYHCLVDPVAIILWQDMPVYVTEKCSKSEIWVSLVNQTMVWWVQHNRFLRAVFCIPCLNNY